MKIFGAGGLRNLAAYGSGFIVSPEGHVVTVWNHVLDSENVIIVLNDGRRYQAKVLGYEPDRDLAVLKIDAEGLDLPYFELDGKLTAGTGSRVLAFSNMFKVATGDEPVSVMHGVISARTKLSARRGAFDVAYDGPVYIVDSATNNTGAAGGALTTRDGRLLGMIGKELRNAGSNTWIHYAIPVSELADLVTQIRTGQYKSSNNQSADESEMAIRYRPLDFGIVLIPDVVERTPAYLDTVITGSAAAKAGMRPDDLVLFVNDELIQSSRAFKSALGRLEAGDTLKLVVRRKNRLETFELTVPRKNEK
ncbi:MAG: S1C family serine protease [Planctomycetaceae bacterium]